jgi:hypothetical protein
VPRGLGKRSWKCADVRRGRVRVERRRVVVERV